MFTFTFNLHLLFTFTFNLHLLFTFTFDLHLETDEGSFSEMEPHEGDAARVLLRRADREAEAAQARNDDHREVRRFRNEI